MSAVVEQTRKTDSARRRGAPRRSGVVSTDPRTDIIVAARRLFAEKGYRSASFGCYIVLYTFADQAVFIEHIFHQRQDYAYLT